MKRLKEAPLDPTVRAKAVYNRCVTGGHPFWGLKIALKYGLVEEVDGGGKDEAITALGLYILTGSSMGFKLTL